MRRIVPQGAVQPGIVLQAVELDEIAAIEDAVLLPFHVDGHLPAAGKELDGARVHRGKREARSGERGGIDAADAVLPHREGPIGPVMVDPLVAIRLRMGAKRQQAGQDNEGRTGHVPARCLYRSKRSENTLEYKATLLSPMLVSA